MVQLAGDEQCCFLLRARGKQTPASPVLPCRFAGWALPYCQRFPDFGVFVFGVERAMHKPGQEKRCLKPAVKTLN